ncbi:hypothetical protein [Achromobacter phage SE2]|nr:hypothetical protein [Achromobacter phage SE2]
MVLRPPTSSIKIFVRFWAGGPSWSFFVRFWARGPSLV